MINIMSYLRYILIMSLYDKTNDIKTVYRNVLMKYLPNEQHELVNKYIDSKVFISVNDV